MEASLFRFVTSINVDFMKLLACFSFTVNCAVNCVSFLKNAQNPKHVQKFFTGFETLNVYGGAFTQSVQLNKLIKYALAISFMIYCFAVGLIAYTVFMTDLLYVVLNGFGVEPSSLIIRISLVTVFCIYGLEWILPNCVELCVGLFIYREYRQFYKSFSERLQADRSQMQESIEIDRQRFVQMARIVETVDKILSLHHGASFASDIANVCLILYITAYYSNSSLVSIIFVLLMMFMADIVIICISGILINTAVRQSCI